MKESTAGMVKLPSGTPRTSLLRVEWLDGIRGLAALFVVLHHSWLMTVGGYPGNNGPWFTDWLIYGHLAVSVFIVVSGYSLCLSPSRYGMKLRSGGRGFLRRRFWRIVPPYWAALIVAALLIQFGLYAPADSQDFGARDFLVHFLLLQDAIGNTSPNGAFWSIAVEWHIYFLFPLILWGFRRHGIRVALPATAALVIGQHLLGQVVPAVEVFNRFTPAYLVLFMAGASAAWLVQRREGGRAGLALAGLLATAAAAYLISAGSVRTVETYFWVDLVVGSATASLFVALGQGRLRWLGAILALRPLAFLGSFAFSLYLIHAPVLAMLTEYVVRPSGREGLDGLHLLLLVGCPSSVAVAYLFFLVFERPFLTNRSFSQIANTFRAPFASSRSPRWSRIHKPKDAGRAPATHPIKVTEP